MTLPKNPDRRKTYYKVTNRKENHRGLQYHDGLVIDPKPFNDNPDESCTEGGIYFSTKEHIHRFFEYGCWVRFVRIPKNAKIIADLTGDKYRADRLFFGPRKDFEWYFNNLFDKKTFPKSEYWVLATYCSDYFDKWFDKRLFPREDCWMLAKYCSDYFDKWFDIKSFPEDGYWALAQYCSDYFSRWFDKKVFPKDRYWVLEKYCQSYYDKWGF